jgi:enoyl-[acyl-carrier protein] reductase I
MLSIDLSGKLALICGIADDKGFGWAIAKALRSAGASIVAGTWPPAYGILTKNLERGKLDTALPHAINGPDRLEFERVYPLDADFDSMDQVPDDVKGNRRYEGLGDFTLSGLRQSIVEDFGDQPLAIVIHSLANGPDVKKPLLETSRRGYLQAMSTSAFSFVSMVQQFSPIMQPGGSFLSLTYLAADRVVPGYGGGMSSAKAALESDTRVLAFEAGRSYGHRVNAISAGAVATRAAKAIGFIDSMVEYNRNNAPLQQELSTDDVGLTAAYLCSDMARMVTGSVVYVDGGVNVMGKAAPSRDGGTDPRDKMGLPQI